MRILHNTSECEKRIVPLRSCEVKEGSGLTLIWLRVKKTRVKKYGMPGWRNWQTRRTQNPVLAREWEFDPPSGHHRFMQFQDVRYGRSRLSIRSVSYEAEYNLTVHIPVDMSQLVAYSLRPISDERASHSS